VIDGQRTLTLATLTDHQLGAAIRDAWGCVVGPDALPPGRERERAALDYCELVTEREIRRAEAEAAASG
jgi:hypothetical protein